MKVQGLLSTIRTVMSQFQQKVTRSKKSVQIAYVQHPFRNGVKLLHSTVSII